MYTKIKAVDFDVIETTDSEKYKVEQEIMLWSAGDSLEIQSVSGGKFSIKNTFRLKSVLAHKWF